MKKYTAWTNSQYFVQQGSFIAEGGEEVFFSHRRLPSLDRPVIIFVGDSHQREEDLMNDIYFELDNSIEEI